MQVRRRIFDEGVEHRVRSFASSADYRACRRLHRLHGTTYFLSALLFPAPIRRRTHAVYGFVRVADDWVDNPGSRRAIETQHLLDGWRTQYLRGLDGVTPRHPAMRAFCDVCREVGIPVEEPLVFLDAMSMDLTITRYPTYEDLRGYMRGSAAAVGAMMAAVIGQPTTGPIGEAARSLGEAMQLTNFLRDVGEDAERGRIYLPQADLAMFGVTEESILAGEVTEAFVNLMRYEIERTRALYASTDPAIDALPRRTRLAIQLARRLYAAILDKIEQNGYDVFTQRARTTSFEKIQTMARLFTPRGAVSGG